MLSTVFAKFPFSILLCLLVAAGAVWLIRLCRKNHKANRELDDQHAAMERFFSYDLLKLIGQERLHDVELSQSVELSMGVLFSDIRSYTRLSETLDPKEVFELLNAYFSRVDTAITARNGFIDHYIGDAVMALFVGTVDDALRAAIAMRNRTEQFNIRQEQRGNPGIHTGFGLHFGEVSLGCVGTARRMQITAIGDTVNLAARLEEVTRTFNVDIILSDDVYNRLELPSLFRLRKIDTVRVRGKERPVVLYEAYDGDAGELAEQKDATLADFSKALSLYECGEFDEALALFKLCGSVCPEDPLPPIYVKRCNTMKRIQPGPDWAGVSTI